MNSKIILNEYISISSEINKIAIYLQGVRFQEYDYSFVNEILKTIESKSAKTIIQDNNECFAAFMNIMKLWIKKKYDTRILPYNISLPLLRKLVEVGDSIAKKVFTNEILKNLCYGDPLILKYIYTEKYDEYLAFDIQRKQIHIPKFKEIKLTIFMCLINIFLYIIFTEIFSIDGFFIFDTQKIINNFEIWRLFTALFMNSERFPLLINTFFLYFVGSYFEVNNFLTRSIYFIVYSFSGILGNLLYLLISPQFPDYLLSAGPSGAIFGLGGAFFIVLLIKRKYWWSISFLCICIFFYIFTIDPKINYFSHLFGFVSGITGYLLCLFLYQHKHFHSNNL